MKIVSESLNHNLRCLIVYRFIIKSYCPYDAVKNEQCIFDRKKMVGKSKCNLYFEQPYISDDTELLASYLPKPKKINSEINDLTVFESAKKELKTAVSNLKDINWKHYWDVFSLKATIDLSFGIMQTNLGILTVNVFKIHGRDMGYMITLMGIASILSNICMIRLNRSIYVNDKGYTRILHGSCLLLISYIGLGLSSEFSIFLCFIVGMNVSRSLLDPSLNDLLNSKVNSNDKGKMFSTFDSILSLTGLVAPILSSILASIYGDQFAVLLCSIPAFIGIVISYSQKQLIFDRSAKDK